MTSFTTLGDCVGNQSARGMPETLAHLSADASGIRRTGRAPSLRIPRRSRATPDGSAKGARVTGPTPDGTQHARQ
jgi:hypothetical protein